MSFIEHTVQSLPSNALEDLLASHRHAVASALAANDSDWTHRNIKTGQLYKFPLHSAAQAELHRLLAIHMLETGQQSSVRPRAASPAELVPNFIATCVLQASRGSQAQNGLCINRIAHSHLLVAYRTWSGDWDSSASQVAAAVRKLGFITVRSHGVRYWADTNLTADCAALTSACGTHVG